MVDVRPMPWSGGPISSSKYFSNISPRISPLPPKYSTGLVKFIPEHIIGDQPLSLLLALRMSRLHEPPNETGVSRTTNDQVASLKYLLSP